MQSHVFSYAVHQGNTQELTLTALLSRHRMLRRQGYITQQLTVVTACTRAVGAGCEEGEGLGDTGEEDSAGGQGRRLGSQRECNTGRHPEGVQGRRGPQRHHRAEPEEGNGQVTS